MTSTTTTTLLRWLADRRATMAGFALLAAVVLAAHVDARLSSDAVALPLAVLALNLAAALAVHPALRRGGLAVFHVALLAGLLTAAVGRLLHYEGRIEVADGSHFDAAEAVTTSIGAWHGSRLARAQFEQGPFEVNYAPGLRRARTASQVRTADGRWHTVGDDQPLVVSGVRFYTTHNKGFAAVLRWQPATAAGFGDPVTGRLHFPSYPLFDWKQEQSWQPQGAPDGEAGPGAPVLHFALRLATPLDERAAWTLRPEAVAHTLVLEVGGERFELRPGDQAQGAFGRLRYERLSGWMGYRIHDDPTLAVLLALAVIGAAGLAVHVGLGARAPGGAARRLGQATPGAVVAEPVCEERP